MPYPIFSVIGATASGKTAVALAAAQKLVTAKKVAGVVLLSADSRQVYRGLECLTGSDIPAHFVRNQVAKIADKNYFEYENIVLCGLSCCQVSEEWSVAHFQRFAHQVIAWADQKNYLVIIVGGTGLYHEQLFQNDPQLHIPPSAELRAELADKTVAELQEKLNEGAPAKLACMNSSDRANPTRLVRAIEVAQALQNQTHHHTSDSESSVLSARTHYYFGLQRSLEATAAAIESRVQSRFTDGAGAEVRWLLEQPNATPQALSTLGVSQLSEYVSGTCSQAEALQSWSLAEFQYAKRQVTWWKRLSECHWHDGAPENRTAASSALYDCIAAKL